MWYEDKQNVSTESTPLPRQSRGKITIIVKCTEAEQHTDLLISYGVALCSWSYILQNLPHKPDSICKYGVKTIKVIPRQASNRKKLHLAHTRVLDFDILCASLKSSRNLQFISDTINIHQVLISSKFRVNAMRSNSAKIAKLMKHCEENDGE